MDAEIEESDALADLEAYYARKTADEYENICKENEEAEEENEELVDEEGNPVFYVVPDSSERRWQIDNDNYSQLYNFRKEITDKKTADTKKADEDARNAENADRVKYITDKIAVQTTYELAIANAEATYYNTVTTAMYNVDHTIWDAEDAYLTATDELFHIYESALAVIDEGGGFDAELFENELSVINFTPGQSGSTNSVSNATPNNGTNNGNSNNGNVCTHPGCTGHGWYEKDRSWSTWFTGQYHIATYIPSKEVEALTVEMQASKMAVAAKEIPQVVKTATSALEEMTRLAPVVEGGEAILGIDTYTNENLSLWQRGLKGLSAATGFGIGAAVSKAAVKAEDIKKIAATVTNKFENFKCVECAKSLKAIFQKQGIKGEVIEIQLADMNTRFTTIALKDGTVISENGIHRGVKVGDIVFDNIHKEGIPYTQWLKQFDVPRTTELSYPIVIEVF